MDPRDPVADAASLPGMERRRLTSRVRATRGRRTRGGSPFTVEDALTTAAAAVLGGLIAIPLVGWDGTAAPSSWAVLALLSTSLGATVVGLRTLWSDERAATRSRAVRLVAVDAEGTCARWSRRGTTSPSVSHCRHTSLRTGPACLARGAATGHTARPTAHRSTTWERAHRPLG